MGELNRLEAANTPLAKFLRGFNKINCVLLVIAGVALFCLMCCSVFMRYILKTDMRAMEEYLFFVSTWAIFLGAANGTFEQSHVCGDIFASIFKSKALLWLNEFIKQTFNVLLVCLFAYYSLLFVLDSIALPSYTTILRLNMLVGKSAVLYGAAVMVVYQCYHYAVYISGLCRGNGRPKIRNLPQAEGGCGE